MLDLRLDAVRPIVPEDLVVARIREGRLVMALRRWIAVERPVEPPLAHVGRYRAVFGFDGRGPSHVAAQVGGFAFEGVEFLGRWNFHAFD